MRVFRKAADDPQRLRHFFLLTAPAFKTDQALTWYEPLGDDVRSPSLAFLIEVEIDVALCRLSETIGR